MKMRFIIPVYFDINIARRHMVHDDESDKFFNIVSIGCSNGSKSAYITKGAGAWYLMF